MRRPIGVFDSGLGGLTVVKALMKRLPAEDIVYYGDTAHLPYGSKSKESIIRFSLRNAEILLRYDIKVMVVACNSSSSYALAAIKKAVPIPVVGVIEPSAAKAVAVSKNKKVGIIATHATINSQAYIKAIHRLDSSVRIFANAAGLLVPLVEEGWVNSPIAVKIVRQYLQPLRGKKIDTLILGCTHYPLLKPVFRKILGPSVTLIDAAVETASRVEDILKEKEVVAERRAGRLKCFISDRPQEFESIARRFLAFPRRKDIKFRLLREE